MAFNKPKISEQLAALQGDLEARDVSITELQSQIETITAERDALTEQVAGAVAPEVLAEAEAKAEQAEKVSVDLVEKLETAQAELETANGKLNLRVLADASEGAEVVADGGTGDGGSILDEWKTVRGTSAGYEFWKNNKEQILDAGRV